MTKSISKTPAPPNEVNETIKILQNRSSDTLRLRFGVITTSKEEQFTSDARPTNRSEQNAECNELAPHSHTAQRRHDVWLGQLRGFVYLISTAMGRCSARSKTTFDVCAAHAAAKQGADKWRPVACTQLHGCCCTAFTAILPSGRRAIRAYKPGVRMQPRKAVHREAVIAGALASSEARARESELDLFTSRRTKNSPCSRLVYL